MGEVVADGEEELVKVANMAKSVSKSGGGSTSDGKPKKDRRTTMLGRFRRPKAAAAAQGDGGAGGEGVGENAALANYITSKKDKKVCRIENPCGVTLLHIDFSVFRTTSLISLVSRRFSRHTRQESCCEDIPARCKRIPCATRRQTARFCVRGMGAFALQCLPPTIRVVLV